MKLTAAQIEALGLIVQPRGTRIVIARRATASERNLFIAETRPGKPLAELDWIKIREWEFTNGLIPIALTGGTNWRRLANEIVALMKVKPPEDSYETPETPVEDTECS